MFNSETAIAHARHRAACVPPTIIDDEISQQEGALGNSHRRLSEISKTPKTLHSPMNLPFRPALKRPTDAPDAHEERKTKRARESHDSDQAKPGDTPVHEVLLLKNPKFFVKAYIAGLESRRQEPRYLDQDQVSSQMSARNRREISRSALRPQSHRPRMTAHKAKSLNAQPVPQTTSTPKLKTEDFGDRIDFLNFGYDDFEPKTPEERLMKYRADVELSRVHAKRYKLMADRKLKGFYADKVPLRTDETGDRLAFLSKYDEVKPQTPEEKLMKLKADVEFSKIHQDRYRFKTAELLFEGRAIFAQLMVNVEESRLKRTREGAADANSKATLSSSEDHNHGA
ncbi:uncharacterized protein J4E88_003992 [Alternaria novae-zelandiae]|uniref:uncharacterized protein n=1 Tax=Alternaria novae-zelandiae TaxID=430562 RepID=UPI0020C2D134|nr:uncharacterized protein J4E88_003992 [Alternaria novae-zelandiae]KAI4686155.1 hypothetical protein J4E88_003992 [Alternaria novae-zelandiae]